jgi:hypothetical protein
MKKISAEDFLEEKGIDESDPTFADKVILLNQFSKQFKDIMEVKAYDFMEEEQLTDDMMYWGGDNKGESAILSDTLTKFGHFLKNTSTI